MESSWCSSDIEVERVLVVGLGEVGKPMYEVARGVYSDVDWLDIEDRKVKQRPTVMHICFPEGSPEGYIKASVGYIERFSPGLVLLESTVSPGTTMAINKKLRKKVLLCHSPVRGNITEGMKRGLLQYTKYIGPVTPNAGKRAAAYYQSLGIKTKVCHSPAETELGKLFETTYRGIMMSWFQEISRMSEHFGARFDEVVDFIGSTEKEGKQARPVFHPGVIGGHCIIPNAEKLKSAYDSKFVEALLESNLKRQKEVQDEGRR
jgi:UDP-N-acetyl-D-mannosaminuronate dehydrogenase